VPLPRGLRALADGLGPTVRYLFGLESHVYACAIAANVLLSFFPLLVLVLTLARGWPGAQDLIYVALRDLLPSDPGLSEFVVRNVRAAVESRGGQLLSAGMLVFSSNGIFVPLEVAQNRLWGFAAHRSYWRNQALSLVLTFACGLLLLAAGLLGSASRQVLRLVLDPLVEPHTTSLIALKLAALPCSIVALLLIYRLLPNGPVPLGRAVRASLLAGLTMELTRYAYLWAWPVLGFRRVYGPFFVSVTLLVWGYLSALVVLAGTELAARQPDRTQP
jgi:membrane protein/epoxyqueuosine reductase